mgnify:CR=1 FL=1
MSKLRRIWAGIVLFGMFAYDLVVARIIVAPRKENLPAIVVIPVDAKTRWGVALFAYLVSVTPGSTSLHVADDLSALYVHLLHAPDPEARIHGIKQLYESHILRMEGREVPW